MECMSILPASNLYETLYKLCFEETRSTKQILTDDLGNFESVWQFLAKEQPCTSSFSIGKSKNNTSLKPDKIRQEKRRARVRRRDAARVVQEDRAVHDTLPALEALSSAHESEACTSSSDEETQSRDRLVSLRRDLEAATDAFVQTSALYKSTRRTAADRLCSLQAKLIANFPGESFKALQQSPAHRASCPSTSIQFLPRSWGNSTNLMTIQGRQTHIFIDSSNIYLGFQDLLQREFPGLYTSATRHKPTIDLHVLDSILNRGRPNAVKALVGSAPLLQDWSAAKAEKYEVSILERVSVGNNQKKEQGVDELLHMKMMESLLDSPAQNTMVLATGDANIAQFSSGFFNVVLRALGRGWAVEVWAFRRSVNKLWLDTRFREEFKTFTLHYLDDYINELQI